MPIISKSDYPKQPWYYGDQHGQTLIPGAFRKVKGVKYQRERLELDDGDFLDLDWIKKGSKKLVFLTHGLEGNSDRQYVKGMAKFFSGKGWDVLAWMCRSCSGEMNRLPRLYHHGEIGDIGIVINHAIESGNYEEVVLIGFSMGGNISMKYLGVNGSNIPSVISKCIAFSSPCDLNKGAEILEHKDNWIYKYRFLRKLKAKIVKKAHQFPGIIDLENFSKITEWRDFDEYFSAPLGGFGSAKEFYDNASAKNFMGGTKVPILLINALNDPILTPECSPKDLCEKHPLIYLENPRYGGHCGFPLTSKPFNWSEYRAWDFVTNGN